MPPKSSSTQLSSGAKYAAPSYHSKSGLDARSLPKPSFISIQKSAQATSFGNYGTHNVKAILKRQQTDLHSSSHANYNSSYGVSDRSCDSDRLMKILLSKQRTCYSNNAAKAQLKNAEKIGVNETNPASRKRNGDISRKNPIGYNQSCSTECKMKDELVRNMPSDANNVQIYKTERKERMQSAVAMKKGNSSLSSSAIENQLYSILRIGKD